MTKRKATWTLEEVTGNDDDDLPSDTSLSLDWLLGFCGTGSGSHVRSKAPLRFCLIHQLYAAPNASNRTLIDTEVLRMRQTGHVRQISTPHGIGLVRTVEYLQDLYAETEAESKTEAETEAPAFTRFASWLKKNDHISVSHEELKAGKLLTDDDIIKLLQAGYLTPRRDVGFVGYNWISHPGLGVVTQSINTMRKLILSAITRSRFKEQSESELNKRNLGAVLYQRDYYYYDLLGSGLLTCTKTPRGEKIFRLPR